MKRIIQCILLLNVNSAYCERISVIGCGYVGLITSIGFAKLGHTVTATDVDLQKISLLQQYRSPFYEPKVDTMLADSEVKENLRFSDNINETISQNNIIFITVGTPTGKNGKIDITAVEKCIRLIAEQCKNKKLIIIKSTIPPFVIDRCKQVLLEEYNLSSGIDYALVTCPEFLREGSAIDDFFSPYRIVWGYDDEDSLKTMENLYSYFIAKQVPIIKTNHHTAALIKYAANSFLATKISFINEIANLCDSTEANIKDVSLAIGLDPRIGSDFLNPGPGFGGSCFPKDLKELCNIASSHDVNLEVINATLSANEIQLRKPFLKLKHLLGNSLAAKTITILGLSFKAGTDDIRYSPAIVTIDLLLNEEASIKAYDPKANENMRRLFPNVTYCTSINDAVSNSDAVIILTEWKEFKDIDFDELSDRMKQKIIVDARNIFAPEILKAKGFKWANIGRNILN